MNEAMNNLLTRRSVRAYADRPVPEAELRAILQAGAYAPTGMGTQAWKLVALHTPEIMAKYKALCQQQLGHFPYYDAPAIALVFVKRDVVAPVMDGSAALENIMLAAASMGIGSCWIHASSALFSTEAGLEFQKQLGVPEDYQCIDGCALGYAQGAWPEAKPRAENVILLR